MSIIEEKTSMAISRIGIKFNYTLFPIDVRELLGLLISNGYTSLTQVPPLSPIEPPGSQLHADGPIARKGDFIVDIQCNKQVIGLTGKNYALILKEINNILTLIYKNNLLHNDRISFYEFEGKYVFEECKDVIKKIRKLGNNELTKHLSEITSKEFGIYSMRISDSDTGPDIKEYYEIWLQPSASRPNTSIALNTVYRSINEIKFQKEVNEMNNIIEDMIKKFFY